MPERMVGQAMISLEEQSESQLMAKELTILLKSRFDKLDVEIIRLSKEVTDIRASMDRAQGHREGARLVERVETLEKDVGAAKLALERVKSLEDRQVELRKWVVGAAGFIIAAVIAAVLAGVGLK